MLTANVFAICSAYKSAISMSELAYSILEAQHPQFHLERFAAVVNYINANHAEVKAVYELLQFSAHYPEV